MDLLFTHKTKCTTPAKKVISFPPKAGGKKPHVKTICGMDSVNTALVFFIYFLFFLVTSCTAEQFELEN